MAELTDRELDAWLAEHLFEWVSSGNRRGNWILQPPNAGQGTPSLMKERGRGWSATNHKFSWWSSTGDGMILVLEAMRERGLVVKIHAIHAGWAAYFRRDSDPWAVRSADTLPRAVALAAKKALEA